MTIYIAFYIMILLFMCIEKKIEHGKNIAFIFVSLALICIVGLRKDCMGVDLPGYLKSFKILSGFSLYESMQLDAFLNYEKGYVIFNSLIGIFSTNEHIFLFTCAFFSLLPVVFFIYKNSPSFSLSIIIYLSLPPFLLTYSALRQSLAIGLCLLSFEFVKKRKFYLFALLIAVAYLFHSSAILFLFAYPLFALKLNIKGRWISVISLFVVFFAKIPIFFVLTKTFGRVSVIDNNGAFTLMFVFIMIYVFCFLYSKQTEKENGLLNIFWLACFCQMFGSLNSIAIRAGYYFMLALVPLLPTVIGNTNSKYENVCLKIVVLICFVLAGVYFIYSGTWSQAYPHYWFWE